MSKPNLVATLVLAAQSIETLAVIIEEQIDSSRVYRLHRRIVGYPPLAQRPAEEWLATSYEAFMAEYIEKDYEILQHCGPQTYAEWQIAVAEAVGMAPDPSLWQP